MSQKPRFPIGTKYMSGGKCAREYTVCDIHTTTNLAGEIVRVGYLTSHLFCGQPITERDICDTTIARGLLPEYQHLLTGA